MIYFVQAAEVGFIKIGFTAGESAADRVASLQTATPFRLDLMATMPGDERTEAALHAAFADLRVRGEWFRPGDRLLSLIAGVRSHDGGPARVDSCWYWFPQPEDPFFRLAPVAEAAYRRGCQHAAYYALKLVERAADLATAQEIAAALQREMQDARFLNRDAPDMGNRIMARLESRFGSRLRPRGGL